MKSAISLSILISMFMSQGVVAQTDDEASDGWVQHPLSVTLSGPALRRANSPTTVHGDVAYYNPEGEDVPKVFFVCLQEELDVTISLNPTTLSDMISATSFRYSTRKVRLFADGEEVNEADWRILPGDRIYRPMEFSTEAKLYNAVLRGETISFKLSGRKPVDLVLPPRDVAFSEFGSSCRLGRNAAN